MTPPTKPGQEGVAYFVEDGRYFNICIGDYVIHSLDDKESSEKDIGRINNALSPLLTELEALRAVVKAADEILDYAVHDLECIRAQWSAGEGTADGGYRAKYAGQWYESRPEDKTPKCNCGLDRVLSAYDAKATKKAAGLGGEGKS